MGTKAKSAVVAYLAVLFGLVCWSAVFWGAASAQMTGTVTYDYYVVAGYEMEPTLRPPATPSDPRFNFTVEAFKRNDTGLYFLGSEGCNFGNLTKDPGYPFYLKAGYEGMTVYGGVYARVNITNLLGYGITITNLTAEVTAGTPTLEFWGPPGQYWGNYTLVFIDPLDTGEKDEVNYNTGEVHVWLDKTTDIDWWTKAVGTPYPSGPESFRTGVVSLVLPDPWGDANATGHVAPIPLAAGETFTEYFGIIIFGDVDPGTQIDGTITLTLAYEYTIPGSPVASFTYTPIDLTVGDVVTFDASNSTANGGNITSYTWDFGDGTSGTGKIVNHTYTAQGIYTVVLNVTDSEELWDTESKSVTVASAAEFPWLWVGVGVVVVIVVVAAVVVLRRRK